MHANLSGNVSVTIARERTVHVDAKLPTSKPDKS